MLLVGTWPRHRESSLRHSLGGRARQAEVDKYNNAVIDMKNAAIATEKARVAHMAAIIAELAPGYVYDTVFDVLVPV